MATLTRPIAEHATLSGRSVTSNCDLSVSKTGDTMALYLDFRDSKGNPMSAELTLDKAEVEQFLRVQNIKARS